ncbi:hypothetical protein BKA81DRAFT_367359 [Phyllosticta paracitricarpa]
MRVGLGSGDPAVVAAAGMNAPPQPPPVPTKHALSHALRWSPTYLFLAQRPKPNLALTASRCCSMMAAEKSEHEQFEASVGGGTARQMWLTLGQPSVFGNRCKGRGMKEGRRSWCGSAWR